jgi:heavy metal-binding protein
MNNTIKKSIVIFSAVAGLFLTACNNTQNKSSNMENHQHTTTESVYACPMHSEVTGKQGDKCSKCGMELELVQKDDSENIEVNITSTPQKIEAGKSTKLAFSITENGKNATLDIVHEKKIHLLIVDEALTWFDHIHTKEQPDGSYTVTENFPYSGKYIVFTDFKARGSSGTVNKQEIEVAGNVTTKPDTETNKWVSKVDGYTVTLVNDNDFKTDRPQHFGLTIEKNGKF